MPFGPLILTRANFALSASEDDFFGSGGLVLGFFKVSLLGIGASVSPGGAVKIGSAGLSNFLLVTEAGTGNLLPRVLSKSGIKSVSGSVLGFELARDFERFFRARFFLRRFLFFRLVFGSSGNLVSVGDSSIAGSALLFSCLGSVPDDFLGDSGGSFFSGVAVTESGLASGDCVKF